MEERLIARYWRLLGIAGLLLLTIATWQFVEQPAVAYAATSPNTVFLDTSASNPMPVKTTNSSGTISYTITNFAGTQVGSGGPLTVSGGQVTVTIPQEPDDYYTLNVTDNTVSPPATQQIGFTMVSSFTPAANSPLGVGTHFRHSAYPTGIDPVISTMGAGYIRDDMTWQDIEGTPGVYNFSSTDTWMSALQAQGLTPLVILDYANSNYDSGYTPYDTAGYTAFANFAKAVVNHYPQLSAIEIYNEYKGTVTGPCASNVVTCYTTLVQYASQAIKSVRSSVTVVAGSNGSVDLNWYTNLFQAGMLSYTDAISVHAYTAGFSAPPESGSVDQEMTAVENLVLQHNNWNPKPIWVTELGWPTCCSDTTPTTQAAYTVRGATLALAGGAQKYFPYDLIDDGTNPTLNYQNFGLLTVPDRAGSYTPKPSYTAYAVLARQLAGATFEASQNQVSSGIYDEVFAQNGVDNLRVLWSTNGTQNITLLATSALTVVSMTGIRQTVQPVNGQVTLTLSGNPIYVQGVAVVPGSPNFATGFEVGNPQPTWVSTVDAAPYPAGGLTNVTGICCGIGGPEMKVGNGTPGTPHAGSYGLLYSGKATAASGADHAYLKVFDLGIQQRVVNGSTTLSYWIYPESSTNSYGLATGSNSTCVAIDLIFSDGTNLRDSGALDQHGNRAHPAYQCNHLTLDTWNLVTVNLGTYVNGKTIIRLDVGYDQSNVTGGYRGYLDDISIT